MEIFEQLGIDGRVLAVNAAAFLLVLYLLNRLFFKPFAGFLLERSERIRQQMTEAEQAREEARQERERMAAEQERQRAEFKRQAEEQRRLAQEEARRIVEQAHRAAQERRRHAEEKIARQEAALRQALRAETAALATGIARKALEETLGPEDRAKSVENAVRQVEQLAEQSSF